MEHLLGHCVASLNMSSGVYFSLFLGGLIGGLTHCTSMCSPFVLMQLSKSRTAYSWLLLPYHIGRMTTYMFLGVLMATLSTVILQNTLKLYLVNIIFIVMGCGLLYMGISGKKTIFNSSFFWSNRVARTWLDMIQVVVRPLMRSIHAGTGYLLGIILGFLPCGLVMMALFLAATLHNPLQAGIGMMFFALGTMPILWVIGGFGQVVATKYPIFIQGFIRVAMIVNAITLFLIAGRGLSI